MRRIAVLTATLILAFGFFWSGQAQSLKRIQATLTDYNGVPLANQTVVIEGTTEGAWYGLWPAKPVRALAVTDASGKIDVVDLPPGAYSMKVLGADANFKKVSDFTLERGYKSKTINEKFDWSESLSIEKIPAPQQKR